MAHLNCQEPARALLPPSSPFFRGPCRPDDLLHLRRQSSVPVPVLGAALFAAVSVAPFFPVAVHDISTMETARARSLCSLTRPRSEDETLEICSRQPSLSAPPSSLLVLSTSPPSPTSSVLRVVDRRELVARWTFYILSSRSLMSIFLRGVSRDLRTNIRVIFDGLSSVNSPSIQGDRFPAFAAVARALKDNFFVEKSANC